MVEKKMITNYDSENSLAVYAQYNGCENFWFCLELRLRSFEVSLPPILNNYILGSITDVEGYVT